jgi:hypothetical protein
VSIKPAAAALSQQINMVGQGNGVSASLEQPVFDCRQRYQQTFHSRSPSDEDQSGSPIDQLYEAFE